MEVPAVCINQESRCTKLSPKGMWRCNLMPLSGKGLCQRHFVGGQKRNSCEELNKVAFNGCGSGAPVVGGGVKRGRPKGSENVEEKLVLEENVGGIKNDRSIRRRRGSRNEEKDNFFDGSRSGARPVHGAAKKRARPEGSGKENGGGERVIFGERGVNILRGSGGAVGGVEKRARQKDLKNKGKIVFEENGGGYESGERGMRWIKVDDGIERMVGGKENGGGDESGDRGMHWIKIDDGIERLVAGEETIGKEETAKQMGRPGRPRGSKGQKKVMPRTDTLQRTRASAVNGGLQCVPEQVVAEDPKGRKDGN